MVTGGNATVFVTDMAAAKAFYSGVLGMTVKDDYGEHWVTVEAGNFTIGLHPKDIQNPPPGTAGSITVGLMVENIASARIKLLEGGAKNIADVVEGSGGSFLHFSDPDGNALYLWQLARQA